MSTEKPLIRFFDDGRIAIRRVRLSYAHLFAPSAFQAGDKKSYSVTGILPKDTHQSVYDALSKRMVEMQKEAFKQKIPADKLCLRDGDLTGKEEYEGCWIIVARDSEENPPLLLDKDGKTEVTKKDDKLYSGAIGNLQIRLWAQNNQYGKRINANLLGVQFVEHGEKFSGVSRPTADDSGFDDEDDGSGEDGF